MDEPLPEAPNMTAEIPKQEPGVTGVVTAGPGPEPAPAPAPSPAVAAAVTPRDAASTLVAADSGAAQSAAAGSRPSSSGSASRSRAGMYPNNVKKLRQAAMMSKAELARRAGVSPLTIGRVESGCPCRMDTKRKILEALGLDPTARLKVFPNDDQ